MATAFLDLRPGAALYPSTGFAQLLHNMGTNGPVQWLAFDATTPQDAVWELEPFAYPVGAPNITVDIVWGAATATSGVVRWSAALAAISPESDTTDPETKSYATATTVDDTHLGTTAKRLHRATITLTGTSLDSTTGGDEVWLKIGRVADHANDTLTGKAWLHKVRFSFDY